MKVRAEQFAADLSKVDWSKLPASMKQDGEQLKAVAPFYSEGGDFKAGIDNYVAALNDQLSKAKPKAAKKAKVNVEGPRLSLNAERTLKMLIHRRGQGHELFSSSFTARKGSDEADTDAAIKELSEKDFVKTGRPKNGFQEITLTRKYYPGYHKEAPNKATGSKSGKAEKAKRSDSEKAAAKAEVAKLSEMGSAGEFAKLSMSQILEVAQSFEANRSLYSQFVDEGADNKKRLTPTPENLVRWMKEPGKYDLIGIDTFEKNNPTADLKIKKEIFWARLLKK
jgi:hypothetical protein